MEYEVYEPDPDDEYYDDLCKVAMAKMFNHGGSYGPAYEGDS